MLPDLYPLPALRAIATLAAMARPAGLSGLWGRLAGRGLQLAGAVAALRASDLAVLLLAERDRWFLWLPVLLGSGIAGYFLLPFEPALMPLRLAMGAGLAALFALHWL
ncbi:hypothetical protein, partial [Ferrovibrio sp.]